MTTKETVTRELANGDMTFSKDCDRLYRQLSDMGDRARKIIARFVEAHGGRYTIDTEQDYIAWVGEETYATALESDGNGNILVHNSGNYSEYLNDMAGYNILDLANHLNHIHC